MSEWPSVLFACEENSLTKKSEQEAEIEPQVQQIAGVKRKRTREVTPVDLLPTPPDTGHRRRIQPKRRAKSREAEGI